MMQKWMQHRSTKSVGQCLDQVWRLGSDMVLLALLDALSILGPTMWGRVKHLTFLFHVAIPAHILSLG